MLPVHGKLSDKNVLFDMKDYFVTINNAMANPDKLKAAKEKYRSYKSIPMMTGFDKTVSFIEKERKGN